MDVTKPYKFIRFGAMDSTAAVENQTPPAYIEDPSARHRQCATCATEARSSIRGLRGPKPNKFIGFGDTHGPKPYKFTGVW